MSYGGDSLSSSDEPYNSDSNSSSDYSYQAVSPITEEEYYTSDSTDESESERVLSKSDSLPPTSPDCPPTGTSVVAQHSHRPTMYRLCGDNIDKTVKQHYIWSDAQNMGSIHYFHSYAVVDRIDFSALSEITPALPSVDV